MTGERVLFVEDAGEVRIFLAEVLTAAGYDVLTAAHGEEGFVLARDLRPDLIITDYMMPGMPAQMLAALPRRAASPVHPDHSRGVRNGGRALRLVSTTI